MICAPLSTCCLRDGQRFLELSGQDQLGELGRAGDVGALADVDEIGVGPDGQRLQAAQAQVRLDLAAARAAANPRTASASALMCGGVVPQQPPTMFSQPDCAHSANCGASVSGVSGKAGGQHRIGQAGVGIGADVNGREAGKLLDERPHFLRPERAIDADAQQRKMRNGIPIRLDRLARKACVRSNR